MSVVSVKYLPATDTKGARFRASTLNNESVTIGYDYGLGFDSSCWKAARILIDELGLGGEWSCVQVSLKEASWVFVPQSHINALPTAESLVH